MSSRITHIINSECDIFVHRICKDTVRIRITEKNPELLNPTDFEIEGNPDHIGEALAAVAAVLEHIEEISQKDPS